MVFGGRGSSLEVVGGSGWPKSGLVAQPRETGQGLFWATLELLLVVVVAAHGGGGVGGVPGEVGGGSGWPESRWRSRQKIVCNRGENRAGWSGKGFGVIFGSLADSIYTKHNLGFIVDIASSQLT